MLYPYDPSVPFYIQELYKKVYDINNYIVYVWILFHLCLCRSQLNFRQSWENNNLELSKIITTLSIFHSCFLEWWQWFHMTLSLYSKVTGIINLRNVHGEDHVEYHGMNHNSTHLESHDTESMLSKTQLEFESYIGISAGASGCIVNILHVFFGSYLQTNTKIIVSLVSWFWGIFTYLGFYQFLQVFQISPWFFLMKFQIIIMTHFISK